MGMVREVVWGATVTSKAQGALSQTVINRLEKQGFNLNCRHCGKPLVVGDVPVRNHISGHNPVTKYCHETCDNDRRV